MPSLSDCSPDRKRLFVGLATLVGVLLSPAGPLRAEDRKSPASLPHPVLKAGEERVFRALPKPTTVEFIDLPLEDTLTFLKDYHSVPIRIDAPALHAARISPDAPMTLKLEGAPFQRTLDFLLEPLELDAYVEGPGLVVTTRAAAAVAIRRRLEKFLEYEVQIVAHVCALTEAQTQKLQLAGRGDIERLAEGIRERKMKVPLVENDEKQVAELLAEITQLQRKIESGPFGEGALFRRTLEKVLTPEQAEQYDPIREVLQTRGLVGTLERGPDVLLSVVLIGTPATDASLVSLKGLKSLGSLRLDGTALTDAGLVYLQELTSLQVLTLSGTRVTDAGLARLKGLTHLQELNLANTAITDAGLVHLKELTSLQELSLGSTRISDTGLAHLKGLTRLQALDLSRTRVTAGGIADLQRALPKLTINK
jgi:hypothetical protein